MSEVEIERSHVVGSRYIFERKDSNSDRKCGIKMIGWGPEKSGGGVGEEELEGVKDS